MFGLSVALLAVASLAACAAERSAAPGLVVLDDVGSGKWRTVSVGERHTCAIDVNGRAWCWGSNTYFQLGVQTVESTCGPEATPCSLVPVPVATGRTFIAISAGGSHTCAIASDSVPFCWGNNSDGQLGTSDLPSPHLRTPGTSPMRSISAGRSHGCGVRTDNLLVCWGSNRFGAVGAGVGTAVRPSFVAGNQRFTSVKASDERTCARTTGGRLLCWGAMWLRTSGDTNFTTIVPTPQVVAGLGVVASMDVGASNICTLDGSGFAWCWESNLHGESGAGAGEGSATPHRIASDEEFTAITVGGTHACGVAASGVAYCWGSNRSAQLGSIAGEFCGPAATSCATTPARVVGRQRFLVLSAGMGNHVCGVSDHLNLYCWGAGSFGQRGDGTAAFISRVPRLAVEVHRQ